MLHSSVYIFWTDFGFGFRHPLWKFQTFILIDVINVLLLLVFLLLLQYTNQYKYWTAACTTDESWLYINYQLWCTDYYLFIKYYSPLHVSSLKCSSSEGYSCTHAAYGTVTLYKSSWWPVGTQLEYRQATRNSHRVWEYHRLYVYDCILLKMSTWGKKHVEENSILWINNNQCIKLVINI